LDWSSNDLIAINVARGICFINPRTAEVNNAIDGDSCMTSLKFDPNGASLGIGNEDGIFAIYSTSTLRQRSCFWLFQSSFLSCDWKDNVIVAGSRSGDISRLDTREKASTIFEHMHADEVCTVRFGIDSNLIATSSNDSLVKIWDLRNMDTPFQTYEEHVAAVRGLQWSPVSRDIIATGGGTSDRTLKQWNVNTGETISSVSTGSQVCNLFWNAEYNEILSTHGFALHQLALWRGSDLAPIAQFYEHTQRVLFMAVSPDETRVATAAPGDDIQIWKMFPSKRMSFVQSMVTLR
jgi:WD40 repeat protein